MFKNGRREGGDELLTYGRTELSLQAGSAVPSPLNKAKEKKIITVCTFCLITQSGHVPAAKNEIFMSKSESVLLNASGMKGSICSAIPV